MLKSRKFLLILGGNISSPSLVEEALIAFSGHGKLLISRIGGAAAGLSKSGGSLFSHIGGAAYLQRREAPTGQGTVPFFSV